MTRSFLEFLKSTVRPDDFVVLKMDIDTYPLEVEIVEAIANHRSLSRLVDELFFEYHFYTDGLDFGWGGPMNASSPPTFNRWMTEHKPTMSGRCDPADA